MARTVVCEGAKAPYTIGENGAGERERKRKKVESWGEILQNSCCKFAGDVVFYRHHDYRYYT